MDECVLCGKNFCSVSGLKYPICAECAKRANEAHGNKARAPHWFTWTVEISIAECWVADGFELTAERAHDIMCRELGWARGTEIECRVISAPDQKRIRVAQGYKDEKESA